MLIKVVVKFRSLKSLTQNNAAESFTLRKYYSCAFSKNKRKLEFCKGCKLLAAIAYFDSCSQAVTQPPTQVKEKKFLCNRAKQCIGYLLQPGIEEVWFLAIF